MAATACIAAVQAYLPHGANKYCHLIHISLGTHESAIQRHLNQFSFCR